MTLRRSLSGLPLKPQFCLASPKCKLSILKCLGPWSKSHIRGLRRSSSVKDNGTESMAKDTRQCRAVAHKSGMSSPGFDRLALG